MSEHQRYQELISRMLDEELSVEERTALAEHLQTCAECRSVYTAFASLSGTLREDLEDAPTGLRENVMAEIRREEIRKKNTVRRRWVPIAAAAAVLALVLAVSPRLREANTLKRSQFAATASAPAAAAEAPTAAGEPAFDKAGFADEDAGSNTAVFDRAMGAVQEENAFAMDEAPEEEAVLPMSTLLELLEGRETELDPAALEQDPVCVIDTDEGPLGLYRHERSLYYFDPADGTLREVGCPEDVLAAFCEIDPLGGKNP